MMIVQRFVDENIEVQTKGNQSTNKSINTLYDKFKDFVNENYSVDEDWEYSVEQFELDFLSITGVNSRKGIFTRIKMK